MLELSRGLKLHYLISFLCFYLWPSRIFCFFSSAHSVLLTITETELACLLLSIFFLGGLFGFDFGLLIGGLFGTSSLCAGFVKSSIDFTLFSCFAASRNCLMGAV